MDRVGSVLLAALLISASSCFVQGGANPPTIRYYETYPPMAYTLIFRPLTTEPIKRRGLGFVLHTTLESISGGPDVGSMGGMYFYHTMTAVELVTTITFSENMGGIWKGSSLNVRGLWKMKANGLAALDNQELSIVGGQGSLRGASGFLIYKKVDANKWLVTCTVFTDDRMQFTQEDLDSLDKSRTELVDVSPETTESNDVLKQGVGAS